MPFSALKAGPTSPKTSIRLAAAATVSLPAAWGVRWDDPQEARNTATQASHAACRESIECCVYYIPSRECDGLMGVLTLRYRVYFTNAKRDSNEAARGEFGRL